MVDESKELPSPAPTCALRRFGWQANLFRAGCHSRPAASVGRPRKSRLTVTDQLYYMPSPSSLFSGLSTKDAKRLRSVHSFSCKHLSKLRRRSGESYAKHGLEVATVLRECCKDASLLAIALLHDLLLHPDGEECLRESPLSADECAIVQKMHALRRLHIDARTEDLDLAIESFMEDPRLLPLRMAHRLNDIRHLTRFPQKLRRHIAHESLHIYTAIAGRLNMHLWRYEMEDRCFAVLQPKMTGYLHTRFKQMEELDLECLTQAMAFLSRKLKKQRISCMLQHRIKGIYSTYRKMTIKRRKFEELTDRLAIRIIVPDTDACYRALGVVHSAMHPVPGKLKDYIGAPKENSYRSIHTVVYPLPGVSEQPIEIQIRSKSMHEESEFGSSSHSEYKAAFHSLRHNHARVNLFRNLQNLRTEARSPKQFEAALRKYFSEDHLALFDSHNNLYHLRKPAAALDFVCHAFPKQIPFLKEMRVNGRKSALDTPLRDGDIVEPVFGAQVMVRKEWLEACRHTAMRKHVREILAQHQSGSGKKRS